MLTHWSQLVPNNYVILHPRTLEGMYAHRDHKDYEAGTGSPGWSSRFIQFSSRWYLCVRKSLYALHPVSQMFSLLDFHTAPEFDLCKVVLYLQIAATHTISVTCRITEPTTRGDVELQVITTRMIRSWLKCCFTSTETVGLLGTGAQDGHLDFHSAPEL